MDHPESPRSGRFSSSENGDVSRYGGRDPGPLPGEDEPSPADIEECLRLLDEVWPVDDGPGDEAPRQLGRFRIVGELGRGGFGVVFLAEDALADRRVALKVPRVEILTGSESWRRFLREVRAASRLDHPNLVPLLEAGAVGPVGYIVSAYIPGPSLEQWLAGRDRPPDPRWSARLVAALARAIDHVHARSILHRDLKPANVLLHAPGLSVDPADPRSWAGVAPESWVPRICDFGLAKLHEIEEEETRSRVVCGSPPYMAPEQADSRRDEIGPATDVYGLGAILYELLTGRPPFGGKGNLETLRRVVSEEPVPPRRRRPGVPRDLETICLKCLAKRPEQRYATAGELAGDLGRFLDGRPIAARPAPAWERAARWARRHPAPAALGSAVVLAAVAGACGLLWHADVLREKNEQLRREALRAEHHAREAEAHRQLAVQQSRLLGRQLAGSRLLQAQQAVTSGQYERARRLLGFTASEFGDDGSATFPWRYLAGSIRDHIEVLDGHRGRVISLAISADGRHLASGDDRGEIRIWGLDAGRCRILPPGAHRAIGRLAWSPDGVQLASADRETGEVLIWAGADGECRGRLEGTGSGEPIWGLRFEGRGRRLVAVGPRRDRRLSPVRYWDLIGAAADLRDPAPAGSSADPSPRNDRLRSLVDLLDGDRPPAPTRAGSTSTDPDDPPLVDVAFTGDHAFGIVARGDEVFEVFRGGSWVPLATVGLRPGRERVVLLAPRAARDRISPAERQRLDRLATGVVPGWRRGPSSSTGPARVLESWTGASGPEAGEVVIWNEAYKRLDLVAIKTGEERRVVELGPLTGVEAMALGPDGATLAVGTEDHRVRVWHRRPAGRTIATGGHGTDEAWAVAFSPDGRTLASGGDDHRVRLWDPATGRERAVLRGQVSLITSLAFSPDGRALASGSFDPRHPVMLREAGSWNPRAPLEGPHDSVRCIAFSPDGRTLASCGKEASIYLWDATDGRLRASVDLGRTPGPARLAFSPDGRTLACSRGWGLDLLEVATGRYRTIPIDEEVHPLIFSADGSRLIIGLRDGSIRTWDLAGGREVASVQGHAGLVIDLVLSPDGAILASAGEDGTVRLWDAATGQEVLCLTECRARVNSVAFSPDGGMLAAADHSGAVTIWDARPRR